MTHCKAILWDVGGTLVEFACTLPVAVRRRLDGCRIDHSTISDEHIETTYTDFLRDEQQWRTIEHERAAERRWINALLYAQAFAVDDIERILDTMPRCFDIYRPVPGLIELLNELRDRGLAMAVVSNWPPSLPDFLQYHGLTKHFDEVVYSAQDGIHKPDPRIFHKALDRLGVRPEQAIFIGDNPVLDIVPSRAMGMRAIHFDPRRRNAAYDADDVPTLRRILSGM